jgi:hypothetical protein
MARKRQTFKERLRQEIERARLPDLDTVLRGYEEPDCSDQRIREVVANVALTLSNDASDAPLRKAFQKFGLNPSNPRHWKKLLSHLARIHFFSSAPRGARPKWDEHKRRLLEFDVARACKRVTQIFSQHGNPSPTDEDIASYLIFTLPKRYGSLQLGTLRKYITSEPPKGRSKK